MSDLVVISFPTEAKAEEVRQKLLAMQKEYLIELGDAVIAVKDANGRIKLNQLLSTTAAGAVLGNLLGLAHWVGLFDAVSRRCYRSGVRRDQRRIDRYWN